jgi:hypothetical protein
MDKKCGSEPLALNPSQAPTPRAASRCSCAMRRSLARCGTAGATSWPLPPRPATAV